MRLLTLPLLLIAHLLQGCAITDPRGLPIPRLQLDWSAGGRWVHVDHVDPARAQLFEQARKRWLARLAQKPRWQPDGRPLFWSGAHGTSNVYFIFHPYATWSDLAARADAAAVTNEAAGQSSVKDYDSADLALVPPHRSELWRRLPQMDFGPVSGAPSELSSRRLVVEFRHMPTGATNSEMDELWAAIQRSFAGTSTRARAQAWWSAYGSGDLVLLWTGSDGAGEDREDPLRGLSVLGEMPDGAALLERAEKLAPLGERIDLFRRDDLSNMPRNL